MYSVHDGVFAGTSVCGSFCMVSPLVLVKSFTVDVWCSFIHGGLCSLFAIINCGLHSWCQCTLHHPPLLDQTSGLRKPFSWEYISSNCITHVQITFDCTFISFCCWTVYVASFRNPPFSKIRQNRNQPKNGFLQYEFHGISRKRKPLYIGQWTIFTFRWCTVHCWFRILMETIY